MTTNVTGFGAFVASCRDRGELVVQPRMGFASPLLMRAGLEAVKQVVGATAGTLTLDSYTRTGNFGAADRAVRDGAQLNGYPLVAHGAGVTRALVAGLIDADFAVQVRHGSSLPRRIFETLIASELDATEGGPVSYCLPYGQVPLRDSVAEWSRCCELLAARTTAGRPGHLETFGGCMLGQLCPPSLLVALSILEGLFFAQHGIRSISLSYAQQTNHDQDVEAVRALRTLAHRYLRDVEWHAVVYTYMGVFPITPRGAHEAIRESVRLARETRTERLIVKTASESARIPRIADNVTALTMAAEMAQSPTMASPAPANERAEILTEATQLIEATLEHQQDVGGALVASFEKGHLDVPFCLHPDNGNRARCRIDHDGRLRWTNAGSMPVTVDASARADVTAQDLLTMLTYVRDRFDRDRGSSGAVAGVRC